MFKTRIAARPTRLYTCPDCGRDTPDRAGCAVCRPGGRSQDARFAENRVVARIRQERLSGRVRY